MITGIIAEYNPFHKGHEFHIGKTKELTHGGDVVVVLSGDFVQRGEPSVISKYIRTRLALLGGADLVLELPGRFATAGAADFAFGGVSLLDSLGVVGHLSFGCEETDTGLLERIADLLFCEPPEFKTVLNERLKAGESFPAARESAIVSLMENEGLDSGRLHKILSASNNILALEYLKSLKKLGSSMKPLMIKRLGDGYNESITGDGFASASGIRELLEEKKSIDAIKDLIPEWEYEILSDHMGKSFPVRADDFIYLMGESIRREKLYSGDLTGFADVSEELSNRIMAFDSEWKSHTEVCKALKTRQYTYSRISRALIHILLDIRKSDEKKPGYARVLGFRESSSGLLKKVRETSKIPVITRVADAKDQLSGQAAEDLSHDIFASELYEDRVRALFGGDDDLRFNEYKQGVIII